MKYFLSYGNKRFILSRDWIKKKAEVLNIFDDIIIETEDICNDNEIKDLLEKNQYFKKVFQSSRGGVDIIFGNLI